MQTRGREECKIQNTLCASHQHLILTTTFKYLIDGGMSMAMVNLVFRYRGPIDFNRFYSEGRAFFVDKKFEFSEPAYKDKSNEFEGEWAIENPIDMYAKAKYSVKFKAFDLSPATITRDGKQINVFNGKFVVKVSADLDGNYSAGSISGKKEIFNDKPGEKSWLHNIYKNVTARDRDEEIAGNVIITAHNFVALVKTICDVDAK